MGAARAVHVADDAIRGSDMRATLAILAAALGKMEFDLVFAGADSSDGQGGVLGAALAVTPRLAVSVLRFGDRATPRWRGAHPTHQRRGI